MACRSYCELKSLAQRGRDYRVTTRKGQTGLIVMAPHGGGIEPGTDALALALAGRRHAFYGFVGRMPRGNASLHIPSHRFDEPAARRMAHTALWVLTLHGRRGTDGIIRVGGRDCEGGRDFQRCLRQAGFKVRHYGRKALAGRHPGNLCNRGRSGRGVQLEIARDLRAAVSQPGERPATGRRLLRSLTRALGKIHARTAAAAGGRHGKVVFGSGGNDDTASFSLGSPEPDRRARKGYLFPGHADAGRLMPAAPQKAFTSPPNRVTNGKSARRSTLRSRPDLPDPRLQERTCHGLRPGKTHAACLCR